MQKHKLNIYVLLLGLLSLATWQQAYGFILSDGYSHINIKEAHVEGVPKGSSIQASINGHALTVSFTENLGQVAIEVSTVSGISVEFTSTPTPNGVQCYIPNTGDYIVTFTLTNGDEYYGEFSVTE